MFNPFSLENKVVVISGAASGIARQCAISCSKMGAKLILLDLNEEGLKETMTMVERPEEHYWASVNLLDYDKVGEIIKEAVAKVGRINGLLNCAGISTTNLFKLTKPEELDKFFHVNVYTGYFLAQECCKMGNLSKEGGSIVFFSSVAGSFGETGKGTYGMTKAALLNLAKHLACELARKNVRVNSISPGAICTPINMNLPHMKDPEKRAALEAQHLLGLGETTDIANACIYLLSDASRWVTGTNLFVGGAYHSPLMEPARVELAAAIEKAEFKTPCCPIYQNVDAKPYTDPVEIKKNLLAQLTSPVRWTQTVINMINDGAEEFVECGPGTVLTGLIGRIQKSLE